MADQPGPSSRPDPECRDVLAEDQLNKANSLSLLNAVIRANAAACRSESVEPIDAPNNTDAVPSTSRAAVDSSDENLAIEGSETLEAPSDLPPRGALYRKPIAAGEVYVVKKSSARYWGLAKVMMIICNVRGGVQKSRYLVGFAGSSTQPRPVYAGEMAYIDVCATIIPKGCGVVTNTLGRNTRRYYSGIVIETPEAMNRFRYLVFFDGMQPRFKYFRHEDLRVICDVIKAPHTSRSTNIERMWLKDALAQPEPFVMKFRRQDDVALVENDLKTCTFGKVDDIDCSIVRLAFPDGRMAWYHRGSYEFQRILAGDLPNHLRRANHRRRNLVLLQKAYQKPADAHLAISSPGAVVRAETSLVTAGLPKPSTVRTAVPSTRILPLLVSIRQDRGMHRCNPECAPDESTIREIDPSYSPLVKPYSVGFLRRLSGGKVSYDAPCGKIIQNFEALKLYFEETNIAFCYTNFDFSLTIDPLRILRLEPDCIVAQKPDITDGLEPYPIACVNEVDNTLPQPVKYMVEKKFMTAPNPPVDYEEFVSCCSCTDDCKDVTKCECALLTVNSYLEIAPQLDNPLQPNDVLYKHKRLPNVVRSGIYECNSKCKCSSKCGNRVAQFPISCRLQLFNTATKGWGVRTLHDIPKGTYVCSYVGMVLDERQAEDWGQLHGDQYLMDLDHIANQESQKPGYEEDVVEEEDMNVEELEKRRLSAQAKERLRKRQGERSKSPPKKKAKKPRYPKNSLRRIFPVKQAEYVLDSVLAGNIGRYFNHSCEPNMWMQKVFWSTHDLRFPEIAFFTCDDVPAGSELTWDYEYSVGSVKNKRLYCRCLAPKCRKRLY